MGEYILKEDGTAIINDGVKVINTTFFEWYDKDKIKKVVFPKGLTTIENMAFYNTRELESIEIPDSVEKIGESAFGSCKELKRVKLPKGLKEIEKGCFEYTGIEEIVMPNSVEKIGEGAFNRCKELKKVELPEGIEKIEKNCFNKTNIEQINIPNSVSYIGNGAFGSCANLKEVHFPSELRSLGAGAFRGASLQEVILPNKVEEIAEDCFSDNERLEKVYLPDSVKCIGNEFFSAFDNCNNIKEFSCSLLSFMNDLTFKQIVKVENGEFRFKDNVYKSNELERIKSNENSLSLTKINSEGKYVFLERLDGKTNDVTEKICAKATKWNDLESIFSSCMPQILPWLNYKTVPHIVVVQNMPKNDIPLFYKDNNAKNWAELVKMANMTNDTNKESLFRISYALGVFSESGQESKIATEYIKENIIKKYDEDKIHEIFSDFNSYYAKYNSEYAKFFMLYFTDNPKFLCVKVGKNEIDFLAKSFQHFKKVQGIYPNKRVVTRQDNERLTPEMVLRFFAGIKYENVNEKAEKLANVVRFYGVSEEDYKRIESWYLQGLEIPKDKMTLKIANDAIKAEIDGPENVEDNVATISANKGNGEQNFAINDGPINIEDDVPDKVAESDLVDDEPEVVKEDKRVTYELLEKDDPLGAVIGYITNCCQIINDNGERCVEYGMTQPNSSFLVFRNANNEVLGQAWVWYDEKAKQVTLDNIEVPHCKLQYLERDKELQDEFVDCLVRVRQGFISAMGNDKVQNVTIGMTYNDLSKIIANNFTESKENLLLSNYNGYTDAKQQFIINDRVMQKSIESKKILESERTL
ncbi:MAG: leucine-rich repeat domain-containing protein [Christensenellales bacterium]